ncbi:MAG: hypothetical protein ACLR6W_12810 [Evtepia sp.]
MVYCKDCGKPVVTDETIAAISEMFGKEGSNAWFDKDPADPPRRYDLPPLRRQGQRLHQGGGHPGRVV